MTGWTCVNKRALASRRALSVVRAALVSVLLGEAPLPAGRPRSHVGARIGLKFVNVLGKFPQHARAQPGAAPRHGPLATVRDGDRHAETDLQPHAQPRRASPGSGRRAPRTTCRLQSVAWSECWMDEWVSEWSEVMASMETANALGPRGSWKERVVSGSA